MNDKIDSLPRTPQRVEEIKTPKAVEKPRDDFKARMDSYVDEQMRIAGAKIDLAEVRHAAPDELGDKLESLSDSLSKLGEKGSRLLDAFFGAFGMRRREVDATLHQPEYTAPDDESEHEDYKNERGEVIEGRNRDRAWHAKRVLEGRLRDDGPKIKTAVHDASLYHGIPEPTVIAMIEMECGFRDKARPMKNGKLLSSAVGFSQMTDTTFERYKKDRPNPKADRENPFDGIDMMAWYCRQCIKDVEALKPESKYLISPGDTENLYLAYSLGPTGYLAFRRYQDATTDEQREGYGQILRDLYKANVDGQSVWEQKAEYAKRVAQVAFEYNRIKDQKEQVEVVADPQLQCAPLDGELNVTSRYGHRKHPIDGHEHLHNGCDYGAHEGTKVRAVRNATVKRAWSDNRNGNALVLELDNGFLAKYAHLRVPASHHGMLLRPGMRVSAGDQVGEVGQTGSATGPHLHFILEYQDRTFDPHPAVMAALGRTSTTQSIA